MHICILHKNVLENNILRRKNSFCSFSLDRISTPNLKLDYAISATHSENLKLDDTFSAYSTHLQFGGNERL